MKKILKISLLSSLIVSAIMLSSCGQKESVSKIEEEKFYAPLSGVEVKENTDSKPAFAVMLDNHPQARPQSGLNEADIIYEYKAEGQYTRYMAIFQNENPSVIGPVRSARPYFVNTASEYNAIYCHWGGSEAGYEQIKLDNVKDLDGIFLEGSTYYRNKEVKKRAPHNGYTSYDLLMKASEDKNYLDEYTLGRKFSFDNTENLEKINKEMKNIKADNITFDFFPGFYSVNFIYSPEDDSYTLSRNGETVTDEKDGSDVKAKNIILEYASSKVTGPKLTLTINHIGEGTGKLFTKGRVIDITWEKSDENSPTIYRTADGEEITLNPGLTFIEVMDEKDPVKILPEEHSDNTEESEDISK